MAKSKPQKNVAKKAIKPVVAKIAAKSAKAKPAAVKAKPAPKPVAKAAAKPTAKLVHKPVIKAVAKTVAKSVTKAIAKPAAAQTSAKPTAGKPAVAVKANVVNTGAKPLSSAKVSTMSKAPATSSSARHANGAVNGKTLSQVTCPFAKDELKQWRELLHDRRIEISSDIDALEKDAMEAEDGHTTPLHAAERGSDADLQDVSLGLAGEEKDLLWQIDRALRKIDKGLPLPFGVCEHTRQPIPRQRLQLIPWTPLSIEGATHLESNNLAVEDILIDD